MPSCKHNKASLANLLARRSWMSASVIGPWKSIMEMFRNVIDRHLFQNRCKILVFKSRKHVVQCLSLTPYSLQGSWRPLHIKYNTGGKQSKIKREIHKKFYLRSNRILLQNFQCTLINISFLDTCFIYINTLARFATYKEGENIKY